MSELAISKPRGGKVETQLRALANAADRSNKPTWMLLAGALVLAGGLLYAGMSYSNFRRARMRFDAEVGEAQKVGDLLREHAAIKARTPDLAKLYPSLSHFGSNIENLARRAWSIGERQPVPGVTVSEPRSNPSQVNTQLNMVTVDLQINDQPLDKVFQLLESIQGDPTLRPCYISLLVLNPATSGWTATIRVASYEKK